MVSSLWKLGQFMRAFPNQRFRLRIYVHIPCAIGTSLLLCTPFLVLFGYGYKDYQINLINRNTNSTRTNGNRKIMHNWRTDNGLQDTLWGERYCGSSCNALVCVPYTPAPHNSNVKIQLNFKMVHTQNHWLTHYSCIRPLEWMCL